MDRNSKEYKKLESIWDKKLKDSGFEDIEQKDGNLKSWSKRKFWLNIKNTRYEDRKVSYDSEEEYYRMAGHFLYEYEFSSKREKLMWSLHAEGATMVGIAKILKQKGYKHFGGKSNVGRMILVLAAKMKEMYCEQT